MAALSDEQMKEAYWNGFYSDGSSTTDGLRAVADAADAAVQAAREGQEPFGWYFMDDPKFFTLPGSGFHVGALPPKQSINRVPLYTTPPATPIVPEGWLEVMDMLTSFDPIMMTSSSYGGKVFRVELGFRNVVERNNGHDFLQKIIHLRGVLAAACPNIYGDAN